MNGNSFLIDTNVVLYLLNGDARVATLLKDAYVYVSFITEMELLGFKNITAKEHKLIKQFLTDCTIIDVNDSIKNNAIAIRKSSSMKMPDCIIAATAVFLNIPFITADRHFKQVKDLSLVLYSIEDNH